MKKSVKVLLHAAVAATMVMTMVLFGGCSGDSATPTVTTPDGASAVVTAQAPFTGNANGCANGGISVEVGVDSNDNGVLDTDEVDSSKTQYVCNGENGSDGTGTPGTPGDDGTSVGVAVSTEPAGANCSDGGVKIEVGLDADNNGAPDTVTSTVYICNGSTGPAGVPATATRTMVENFRSDGDYTFIHGTNSPDASKLFVVVNDTNAGEGGTTAGMKGTFTAYLLRMSDVTAGAVTPSSVLAKNTVTGVQTAAKTIAFRQSYTPDGLKIVQAGKDRVVVLDAKTLAPLNGASGDVNIGGGSASFENHDALAIDDNYALLALQSKMTSTTYTGVASLVLYDLNTNAAIGGAVSMCSPCHSSQDPTGKTGGATKNHFMCGIDGKFTESAPGVYTGTLYVSSTTGGHLVYVPVTITPANPTPIVVGGQTTVQISVSGPPASADMPNYHDVRYSQSENRVYYSAIAKASSGATEGRVAAGYVDLADNSVHRASISVEAGSTGSVYCGSGQTEDFFIPMTMNYPGYIDAVRKSQIYDGALINP